MTRKWFTILLLLVLSVLPTSEVQASCPSCFFINIGNGIFVADCIALSTSNGGYDVCLAFNGPFDSTCFLGDLCRNCFPVP
jgi:hypothetical protein